ncbi:ABC transporter permease [Listeria innocua]|uniref:ABC transporter permease n=1 Tax=Listeria innocua TaxID=1642 RepID=UPI0016256942|nr:ABC transporter permease [Listeria innocua]EBF5117084.1 ABC transporter permease [Listeria monocytogenes]EBF5125949.1 ABC transporter permease [Listeria monocytogenes]EBF5152301.1 ABC transporter permease [Listeria monocytogenes]MBC2139668.1 ABC transporter permease [Listeria innocua]
MFSYIVKRILSLIPVLFIVSLITFLIVYLTPGGPATAILGMEATPEQINQMNAQLGFDRPFLVQYVDWLGGIVRGNGGESYFLRQSVISAISEYFGPTLSLAIMAQIFAVIIAIPLGILAAYKRGTVIDVVAVSVSLLGSALPGFLLSMFLMLAFSVYNQWFPVAGYVDISSGIGEYFKYLFLPALSLGIVQAAYLTRMIRSSLLDVLHKGFIQTARAKGLKEKSIILSYGLKNAAPVILTAIGQSFGSLITGTIVTETLFNIPGLGMLTMSAINRRDVFVIQGVVLFVTLLYVLINLLVDVLYGFVDPRLQPGRK